jgi:hypothetical protein
MDHGDVSRNSLVFNNVDPICPDMHWKLVETEMNRQIPMMVLALAAVLVLGGPFVSPACSAPNSVLAMLDRDSNGTVDLTEAKGAGSAAFDRIDKDHDGTVDHRELHGRVSAKGMAAADADGDGSLDKTEYLALIEQRFKAADRDNDGTVDASELRSPAGQTLVRLLT